MMAVVDPDILNSEYDLQLTSGATVIPLRMCDSRGNRSALAFTRDPVRRSSLKMYSDQQKYSDLEPPWTPISQTDWSGGRGSKDFDKDASMYYDGYQVNTIRPGEIILGPKPTICVQSPLMSNTADSTEGAVGSESTWDRALVAFKFTATESITVKKIYLSLRKTSTAIWSMRVGLAAVSSGEPGAVTYSDYVGGGISQSGLETVVFTISAGFAITSSTSYFLVFDVYAVPDLSPGQYLYFLESTTTDDYFTYSGSAWAQRTDADVPYFSMSEDGIKSNKGNFFEYKGALYMVSTVNDATDSKLYLNGDHGLAKTGATTTSITLKGNISWALSAHVGCLLRIFSGTGTNQPEVTRTITASAASTGGGPYETVLTVDAFDVAPAENDVIAIIASDDWTELTAFNTNYAARVTDVLPVNGAVYFATGDSATLIRMYTYNNAGAWTYNYSDHTASSYSAGSVEEDTTNAKFTYLGYMTDETGTYVVGARGGYPAYIKKAAAIDYTAMAGSGESALSWGDAINIGDLGERITGLEMYGEFGNLHILKESSIYYLYDGVPQMVNVREMENTLDPRNGRAHCVKGVYLYISWHNTLLRYYNGMLDTVGPNKAEVAIPTGNRAGDFSALTSFPGIVIGAVDGGRNGVSTVLAYNDFGWCELYRATLGERIQALHVQSIPGNYVDRLWVTAGEKILWLPMSEDPYNHPSSTYGSYKFCLSGEIISPWYYLGLQDIVKLYNSLRVVAENCDSTYSITASYQVDTDSSWTTITGTYDQFAEELDLAATPSVTGKRMRYKLELAGDTDGTPRVLATVLDTITRLPNKYITTVTVDLGIDDTYDYASSLLKFNALTGLQNLATPVTVESRVDMLDGMTAFVDGLTPRIIGLQDTNEKPRYLAQFSLIEI